jgi:ketosteroid isomerase-like protein
MTVPLLAMTLAACEAPPPPAETAETAETAQVDEAAVRAALAARIDAYERAAVEGDLATMKALWTDDVRLFEPGMVLSGAEVGAFYDEVFGGSARVETIDIRTDETFVHGDVAYTIGDYEETLTMTPDAEPMSVHNHWFARWERGADGTWRIDRMVVGTVEAPEEM